MQVYPNSPSGSAVVEPVRVIAGFWRRLLAFAVDAFITALPCGVLALLLYGYFSTNGVAGILTGFVLTMLYFTILGSTLARGQTIGHRITHIQVVDKHGRPVSLKRSFLRNLILLGPVLLSSAVFPWASRFGVATGIDWLMTGAEVAIVYLYLFNRTSRQSLHDLATGTFVVSRESVGEVDVPRFWFGHWAILGGAALVGVVLLTGFDNRISGMGSFTELTAIQQAVLNSGKVQSVSVWVQKNWREGETRTGLVIDVVWKGKLSIPEKEATEIANVVLRTDPQAGKRDFITVRFLNGFMVGFFTFTNNRQVSHSPATWLSQTQTYGLL